MPLPEDSIGYRIRRARMWRGIGQAELARAIGVSANALNSIEQGHTKAPRSDIIQAIARELRASADFLLCLSEKMESELLPAGVALVGASIHAGSRSAPVGAGAL